MFLFVLSIGSQVTLSSHYWSLTLQVFLISGSSSSLLDSHHCINGCLALFMERADGAVLTHLENSPTYLCFCGEGRKSHEHLQVFRDICHSLVKPQGCENTGFLSWHCSRIQHHGYIQTICSMQLCKMLNTM